MYDNYRLSKKNLLKVEIVTYLFITIEEKELCYREYFFYKTVL